MKTKRRLDQKRQLDKEVPIWLEAYRNAKNDDETQIYTLVYAQLFEDQLVEAYLFEAQLLEIPLVEKDSAAVGSRLKEDESAPLFITLPRLVHPAWIVEFWTAWSHVLLYATKRTQLEGNDRAGRQWIKGDGICAREAHKQNSFLHLPGGICLAAAKQLEPWYRRPLGIL